MYLNKFFDLKKELLFLFFCLLCGFPQIKALASNVSKNNITIKKNTATFINNHFNEKVLFLSDTLPGLSKKEKSQGWEVLFDGKNTGKWRGKDSDSFPSEGWAVEDGTLFLNKKGAGDIITREMFGDFELVLDFKLTYSANSGIKYFVGELKNKKTGEIVINGPEYQIIDDYNHPEVKNHKHDIASTASCYLLYAPKNKKLNRAGQWNHVKIIAKGKHVEHWLNGEKVLSYERGSKDFLKRKAATKFKDYEDYGELPKGYILLTDHNDKVYFKNIRIKRL